LEGDRALQKTTEVFPRIINRTGYSTPALRDLVAFALPEYLKRDDAEPWLQFISFRYKPWNWDTTTHGAYTADRKIIIYLPNVFELTTIVKYHEWQTLGGDNKSSDYILPKPQQLTVTSITEDVLSVIAHELHHLYRDTIGSSKPFTAVSTKAIASPRARSEKEAERYAVKIVKRWRKANCQNSEEQRLRDSAYSKNNLPKSLMRGKH
jgi:hypothetical protein